jgi:hypothetical protein
MGTDWDGYRAKTDKAAVRERNEAVDRRHDAWAAERRLTADRASRPGPLRRLAAAVARRLGRG